MRQNQATKIIAIIALCITVVGITLGFAAFSNTLTISSSATVSPNASDFKLEIYGISQNLNALESITDIISDINAYDSLSFTSPKVDGGATSGNAVIDNGSLTISNLKAEFTGGSQIVQYFFMVKNVGEYDALISGNTINRINGKRIYGTCVAGDGTTETLVEEACSKIYREVLFHKSNGYALPAADYWLEKDDVLFMNVIIKYSSSSLADGPFTVEFDDLKVDFSTAA